jgi:hypothetical protein
MISDSIIDVYNKMKNDYKIRVNLTYFKVSGKYYEEGSYMEDYLPIYQIWERVEEMEKLPGLNGKWKGLILIDVPDHIHNHPHIIVM